MIYIILGCAIRCFAGESLRPVVMLLRSLRMKFERWRRSAYAAAEAYFGGASWESGLGWGRVQELFFAEDQRVDVVSGQLEAVTVSDCVGGTCFDAVAAKNTT